MIGRNEKIIIIRKNEKKKKIGADPEMGYCPLSIRLGVQACRRAGGAGLRRALGGMDAQAAGGLAGRAARALCAWHGRCASGHARPGRAAGPAGCALGALSLF